MAMDVGGQRERKALVVQTETTQQTGNEPVLGYLIELVDH